MLDRTFHKIIIYIAVHVTYCAPSHCRSDVHICLTVAHLLERLVRLQVRTASKQVYTAGTWRHMTSCSKRDLQVALVRPQQLQLLAQDCPPDVPASPFTPSSVQLHTGLLPWMLPCLSRCCLITAVVLIIKMGHDPAAAAATTHAGEQGSCCCMAGTRRSPLQSLQKKHGNCWLCGCLQQRLMRSPSVVWHTVTASAAAALLGS